MRTTIYLIFIALVAAMILLSIVEIGIHRVENIYTTSECRSRKAMALHIASNIENMVGIISSNLEEAAKDPAIANMDRVRGQESLKRLVRSLSPFVEAVTRMDSSGVIVLTYPYTESVGKSIREQPHIQQIMRTHQPVISSPIMTVQGFVAVIVHIPIMKGEHFDGSVAALIPIGKMRDFLPASFDSSLNENVWIADDAGRVVSALKEERLGNSMSKMIPPGKPENDSLLALIHWGNSGAGIVTTLLGDKKIVGFAPVQLFSERWVVGSCVEQKAIISPVAFFRKKIYISLFFVSLAIFLIGWFFLLEQRRRDTAAREKSQTLVVERYRRCFDILRKTVMNCERATKLSEVREYVMDGMRRLMDAAAVLYFDVDNKTSTGVCVSFWSVIPNDKLKDSGIEFDGLRGSFDALNAETGALFYDMGTSGTVSSLPAEIVEGIKTVFAVTNAVEIPIKDSDKLIGAIIAFLEKDCSADVPTLQILASYTEIAAKFWGIGKSFLQEDSVLPRMTAALEVGMMIVNSRFEIEMMNDTFRYMVNMTPDESVERRNLFECFPWIKKRYLDSLFLRAVMGKKVVSAEEIIGKTPSRIWLIPLITDDGDVERILMLVKGIFPERQLRERISSLQGELTTALVTLRRTREQDPLTGIMNKQTIDMAITRWLDAGESVGVLLIALDNFTLYNRTAGNKNGDKILIECARTFVSLFEDGTFLIGRLGGDEFLIAFRAQNANRVVAMGERVVAAARGVRGNGLENLPAGVLTVSVGAHICTEDIDKCYSALLNAIEMAKTAGGNRVVFVPEG